MFKKKCPKEKMLKKKCPNIRNKELGNSERAMAAYQALLGFFHVSEFFFTAFCHRHEDTYFLAFLLNPVSYYGNFLFCCIFFLGGYFFLLYFFFVAFFYEVFFYDRIFFEHFLSRRQTGIFYLNSKNSQKNLGKILKNSKKSRKISKKSFLSFLLNPLSYYGNSIFWFLFSVFFHPFSVCGLS